MAIHSELTLDRVHALPARVYPDLAARDADAAFQIAGGVNKIARVDNPLAYYLLTAIGPASWVEISNTGIDSFLKMLDTPSSYAGGVRRVIQINNTGNGLEFGQPLSTVDSPEFVDLELSGDLIVNGDVAQLAVGSLFVGDNNIEIGDVDAPTDITADGGGLTLHGDTDKTLRWLKSINAWSFNRSVDVVGSITVTGLVDGVDINIDVPLNITHRGSDGSDHSLVNLNTIHRASNGSDHAFIDQDVTTLASPSFIQLTVGNLGLIVGASTPFSDVAGVLTLQNIDALDPVTEATLEAAIDSLANLISVQGQSISLLGSLTVELASVLNQDLTTDANPTFNDLILTGNLTVQGTTVTLDALTLLVEDKNIELGVVAVPTDATADGGGITLKGATDKTILWLNATNRWTFNQGIDLQGNNLISAGGLVSADVISGNSAIIANNLQLSGNTLSSINGDIDIITAAGGEFKFNSNSFRAGDNIFEYIQIGHDGFNGFINKVGDGGMDFRFLGITKATLTPTGQLEIDGQIKISGGGPAAGKVLTSDIDGLASWILPAGGGWTDAGANVILTAIVDKVGIGESGPDTKLHVADGGTAGAVTPFAGTIATFESPGDGYISLLTPNANKRGILFGEPSSNIAGGIIFNNGGNAGFDFQFGGTTKAALTSAGHLHLLTDTDQKHNLKIKTANNLNDSGIAWENSGGNFSQTIFRTDVGSNRSDLIFAIGSNADIDLLKNSFKIHGSSAKEGRLEVLDVFQISSGSLGLNKVLTSDAAGVATWEDPAGNIIAQETFASTNARFFGELQLPSTQGWTDVEAANGTVTVFADSVFDIPQDVIRYDVPASGDTARSDLAVLAADWANILTFGASYSGICRITKDVDTQSIFSGIGFAAGNDPRTASSVQSRVGIFISVDATHTTIRLEGQSVVILDGTGGNPLVLKDEWFAWEVFIDPTPDSGTSFGAATLYVNGSLLSVGSIAASNTAVNDVISVQNSSGSGSTTFYFANFGVTIYEDSSTKTLAVATMVADVAQINIPEGRRDYTIILPDGNPRDIGDVLRLVSNNVSGSITLKNQNPSAPEILYNGLRELKIDVFVKEVVEGINTVNSSNVYVGFQTKDIDRTPTIFAQLNSSVDQEPADTNPTVITYNTQDALNNIKHSTTINPGELEILPGFSGTYIISPQPQVGKSSGGVKEDFDMFLQVDRGSGFADEPNSNIKLSVKDPDETDVIVSVITIELNVGDKIRMMQKVSNSAVGMGLKNTDPVVGPPSVPRTPSIIFTMFRKGGLLS